jgi:hypothetical protein
MRKFWRKKPALPWWGGPGEKSRVVRVGRIEPDGNGRVDLTGWRFASPSGAPGVKPGVVWMLASDEGLSGWAPTELHAMAHGQPCECEVAYRIREGGLR